MQKHIRFQLGISLVDLMSSVWSGILPIKNNAGVFHDGVIGNAVAPDIISVFLQFADSFFFQPAAHRMPEFNRGFEFF